MTRPSLGRKKRCALLLVACTALSCVAPRRAATSTRTLEVPRRIVQLATIGLDAATAASPAWKGWSPNRYPFCIVDGPDQWLFQAPGRPPGYDDVVRPSPLGEVYRASSLLEIDGTRSAPPASFFAFTSQGRQAGKIAFFIAVPESAPPSDNLTGSEWATVFVHEYFHTFQLGEHWPVDWSSFEAARPALSRQYERPDYRRQIAEELATERALVDELDERHQVGHDGVAALLEHRRRRRAALGPLAAADSALELVEGTARFVNQAVYDGEAGARALRAADARFVPPTREQQLKAGFGVEGPRYWYATGYGLVRLLEALDPTWHERLAQGDLGVLLACATRSPKECDALARPSNETGSR